MRTLSPPLALLAGVVAAWLALALIAGGGFAIGWLLLPDAAGSFDSAGTLAWGAAGGVVAFALGGWVAARLARPDRWRAALLGLLVGLLALTTPAALAWTVLRDAADFRSAGVELGLVEVADPVAVSGPPSQAPGEPEGVDLVALARAQTIAALGYLAALVALLLMATMLGGLAGTGERRLAPVTPSGASMGDGLREDLGPTRRPAANTAGWLLLLLTLVMFTLSLAAAGPDPLPGDPMIARFIQRLPNPPGNEIARFADLMGGLGAAVGIGLAVAIGLAVRGHPVLALVLLAALLSRALNPLIKAGIDSPRPTPEFVRVVEEASGLGFPSGHATAGFLLWGTVAWAAQYAIQRRAWRLTVQLVAVGLVLVIGFGRVYSGAHWPSDVVGGYLSAAIVIVFLAWVTPWAEAAVGRVRRRNAAPLVDEGRG